MYSSYQGAVVRPPSDKQYTTSTYAATPTMPPGDAGRIILAQALSEDGQFAAVPPAQVVYPQYGATTSAAIPVALAPVPPPVVAGNPPLTGNNGSRIDTSSLHGKLRRHAELNNVIQGLGDASGRRARCEQNLQAAVRAYNDNEAQLKKNRDSQPRAERRLHRNAHPRFLHYLQFNREAKVKRLTAELEALREDERRRVELKKSLEHDVNLKKEELAASQSTESYMRGATAERQHIFDDVVASQPPTSVLSNSRFELQNKENEHRAEVSLLNSVENSLRQVEGARMMFGQAAQKLHEAVSMNMGAGLVNVGQGFRRDRDFGFDDIAERGMQMRRDQLLNSARDIALRAADQLQAAFDSFPMEARVRYPQLTSNICNAPIPNLKGANFFGTMAVGWAFGNMGDMMNDMYAQNKIQNNLRVVRECEQIAAGQAMAVQSILQVITSELRALEARCNQLKQIIQDERVAIFETTRRRILGG